MSEVTKQTSSQRVAYGICERKCPGPHAGSCNLSLSGLARARAVGGDTEFLRSLRSLCDAQRPLFHHHLPLQHPQRPLRPRLSRLRTTRLHRTCHAAHPVGSRPRSLHPSRRLSSFTTRFARLCVSFRKPATPITTPSASSANPIISFVQPIAPPALTANKPVHHPAPHAYSTSPSPSASTHQFKQATLPLRPCPCRSAHRTASEPSAHGFNQQLKASRPPTAQSQWPPATSMPQCR